MVLLIVSSNGTYNSLAPRKEYTDASIDEIETFSAFRNIIIDNDFPWMNCTSSTLAAA
jgi:hypothetical protein